MGWYVGAQVIQEVSSRVCCVIGSTGLVSKAVDVGWWRKGGGVGTGDVLDVYERRVTHASSCILEELVFTELPVFHSCT
jgi:hypothetical protein